MNKRTVSILKKTLLLTCFSGMVLFSSKFNAYAASGIEEADLIQDGIITEDKYDIQYGMDSIALYDAGAEAIANAREAIYQAIVNQESSVNIQQYSLTLDEARAAFNYVINTNPNLFYVNNTFRYSYSYSNPYIISITFTYEYSGDALAQRVALFNAEVDKIIASVDSHWSDLEKALYVHDYFCSHYEYDTSHTRYDAADLFVDKQAVCNGYYLAYRYILTKLGIECEAVESTSMNHIWNQIKINGKWYHVDVTWDDPLDDVIGRTSHKDFLKSDTAFINEYGHSDWTSSYTCSDTSYDSAFWNTVSSPFSYANNTWFCISGKDLYTCSISGNTLQNKVTTVGTWYVSGNSGSYWSSAYSGLASYGGKIYYNSPSAIMCYNPKTTATSTVMSGTAKLYGCYLDNNNIHYGYGTSPNNKIGESGTYTLPLVKTGWIQENGNWYYYDNNGVAVKNCWLEIAGKTYRFNTSGIMMTGWYQENSAWYYLLSGARLENAWKKLGDKWYHFDSNGKMQTGWYKEGKTWYYFLDNGVMLSDAWKQIDGSWYYFSANGNMLSNAWVQSKTKWYYFQSNGSMVANAWKQIGGNWYHFNESGQMQTGWYKEGNAWYYLKSDGSMAADTWLTINNHRYHFGSKGYMTTGWYKEGDNWYYLKSDGSMAVSEWVANNRYYIDSEGHWVE